MKAREEALGAGAYAYRNDLKAVNKKTRPIAFFLGASVIAPLVASLHARDHLRLARCGFGPRPRQLHLLSRRRVEYFEKKGRIPARAQPAKLDANL